jgi:spermidine/putrescine ABC transporter ATP-binding subunit
MEPLLRIKNLAKKYGTVKAVSDFNLEIADGEFISLLGPSGCGKTTVLRCIAGFEKPDTGEIWLRNIKVNDVLPEKRDIGLVFQSYALFPNMRIRENIAFPLRIKGVPREEQDSRVKELLELVQLPDVGERYPYQLSGGQQQRIALARALAKQPTLLLLDEPLSALDAKIREELRGEIKQIQKKLNITAIYVTHDQEEALSISDRIVVMNQGSIQQIGHPTEVYRSPANLFVASFVGSMNFVTGELISNNQFQWKDRLFSLSNPNNLSKGLRVVLAIRPENLHIVSRKEDIPSNGNFFEGIVELITYLGSSMRIIVKVDEELDLKVELPSNLNDGLEYGQKVYVYFLSEDISVFVTRD